MGDARGLRMELGSRDAASARDRQTACHRSCSGATPPEPRHGPRTDADEESEMTQNATHRAETAELVLKVAGTLLIPVVLAIIGYFGNKILQHRQEVETRTRLYSELMSKRED